MKRSELIIMMLQVPLDFLLLILSGVSAYYLRYTNWAIALKPVLFDISVTNFIEIIMPVAVVWLVVFALAGLYSVDPNRKLMNTIGRVFLACSAGLSVVALYIMFTQQLFDSRFLAAGTWAFSLLYITLGRLIIRGIKAILYRKGIGSRGVAIIGHHGAAEEIIKTLKQRKELGYIVIGQYVHFDKNTKKDLKKKKPDEIIFTNPRAHEDETLEAIEFCNDNHITFKYSADLFDTFSTNMTVHPLAGIPVVELKRTPLEGWGRIIKRIFDIIASTFMIIIFSPIMLLVGIGILVETGSPVIYKNKRVGIRGNKFFAWKFRSMYKKDCTGEQFGERGVHAEKREKELIKKQSVRVGPIYKIKDDPRVTKFGKFLRRSSLDELPQFFNVLFGSMSIVGPRPHQPREVEQYEKDHKHVLTIKPGITGLAQISGRSDLSFDEEIRLDVFYIEKWSLLLDIIIFLKTPFILFRKRKAL